ncbi:hypothetical protein M378DRAFT_278123 [Amanita muscaria Koide BX008]|uniref:DUF6699 domain-containing protein n=1 Tax=Amanita muscaria (strain Koide BX008) TaxID=946122 RepID=A0A0C2S8K8_AMAMK|nr:hypothetical protein M378DRAFT_278123 [Amanita muscaria Koide BX008]
MYEDQAPHSSRQNQIYLWTPTQQTGYHQNISPPPAPRLKPIPLPPTPYENPRLHPLLTYAVRPKIAYNLQTSSLLAHPPYARSRWTYEPATSQPTPFMTLKCTMLPGDISVFPSHYQYVTIRDVLSAVSDAYQGAVPAHAREKETRSVPNSLCHDSTVLSTCFMWAGISDQIEPGVWLLHIEELY